MTKKTFLAVVVFLCCVAARSQYVTLTDPGFAQRLQFLYPSCFNASMQMDTTCAEIINEDSLYTDVGVTNLDGLQYFKNLKYLFARQSVSPFLATIPSFPSTLLYIDLQEAGPIQQLPPLPPGLQYLNCSGNSYLTGLPALPATLKTIIANGCANLSSIPLLPDGLEYLNISGESSGVSQASITALPNMPSHLVYLDCSKQQISSLPDFAPGLTYINCSWNNLSSLPASLPPNLKYFYCAYNTLSTIPALPASLKNFNCLNNVINELPPLPPAMDTLVCAYNNIAVLPPLPPTLIILDCRSNHLHSLQENLPANLNNLSCSSNPLYSLPANLPPNLEWLQCANDSLSVLPPLPATLVFLRCQINQLTSLPPLPDRLYELACDGNNIYCLPKIPDSLSYVYLDALKISCIPNRPRFPLMNDFTVFNEDNRGVDLPLCVATNNIHNCQSFPLMKGRVYLDLNSNNTKDANEPYKKYQRVSVNTNRLTFTNDYGYYEIGTTDTGMYNISVTAPVRFHAVPASRNYHFTSFDSIVNGDFAFQPDAVFDSLTVSLVPTSWAARPGFTFEYSLRVENAATTTLTPAVTLNYDNSRVDFVYTDAAAALDNGNNIAFAAGNMFPGESKTFYFTFRIKPTVALGESVLATAFATGGSSTAIDSSRVYVRGSFDPNDKKATPQLSPAQVTAGDYIHYTIRFQNTGTDTAFNIIIADTLSSQLQWNTFQLEQTSHTCKATVDTNKVYFEFRDILLPDSNVNEPKSHGFVSFKIKPKPNVAVNTTINNKASIFFDYNSPVLTNTASTLIKDFIVVPLRLISFTAFKRTDNKISVNWITSNEINTKTFLVEQSSDGLYFTAVVPIAAKGQSHNDYSTSLTNTSAGRIFFRLKIIDNNGSYVYSPIVTINTANSGGNFTITNPVKDFILMDDTDNELNNTSGTLTNSDGIIIKRFIIKTGHNAISVKGLPTSIYYITTIKGCRSLLIQ